jgi:hypothetical protein
MGGGAVGLFSTAFAKNFWQKNSLTSGKKV